VNRSKIADAPTVTGALRSMPDLRSAIAERTRREVHILNDISAAAWHLSRRMAARRFMVVTVSSGIGSKIFDRHHALGVIDDVPYAGEIGHIKVDERQDAPKCDCGGRGHLGAIASGRGILRFARRLAKTDEEFNHSLCVTRFAGTAESLTNEQQLVPAARMGDPWALRVVREGTVPLARLLLQTVIAGGIESVVIIGGFALGLGEMYLAILRQEMWKRCDYRIMPEGLENLIVMGDEDACLLGTAAYASRMCGS
jgi:glucokinase